MANSLAGQYLNMKLKLKMKWDSFENESRHHFVEFRK